MQVGDIVQLKSGGAKMTIEGKVAGGDWLCVWWSPKEESFESRTFNEAALKPALVN